MLRDNGPAPPREDVRSNSRVWYAKGAEEPDFEPVEALYDTEFERSIRNYVMLERRVYNQEVCRSIFTKKLFNDESTMPTSF